MNQQPTVTIKATPKGRSLLRQIAARTGEKHYAVLDRVLSQEHKKSTFNQADGNAARTILEEGQ